MDCTSESVVTEVHGADCASSVTESEYLKLQSYLTTATECMKKVQELTSPRGSANSLKFNNEQCEYLADKLKLTIQSANLFLKPFHVKCLASFSSEVMLRNVDIFKLLVAKAKETESFIQGCCRDAWIQAAMTLTNVSEHISSICFNLELCRIVFSDNEQLETSPIKTCVELVDKVEKISNIEVDVVQGKASRDQETLRKKVIAELRSLKDDIRELASFLLERLERLYNTSRKTKWSVYERFFKNVHAGEQLGKGGCATVRRVTWFGMQVAKKIFYDTNKAHFQQEVSMLPEVYHANVISLFCCTTNKYTCSIFMELMDQDLSSLMSERRENYNVVNPFSNFVAVDIILQLAEGMLCLHSRNVVHRDLKADNVLVKVTDMENGYVHAKLADFGLAKTKESSCTNQTFNTGTNRWMAPEVINFQEECESKGPANENLRKHPMKSDVYSFGMVCYEILTGERPFLDKGANEAKRMIKKGGCPPLPDHCPPSLKMLIEKCWKFDPRDRPSFSEICKVLKCVKYLLMTLGGDVGGDVGMLIAGERDSNKDQCLQNKDGSPHKMFPSCSSDKSGAGEVQLEDVVSRAGVEKDMDEDERDEGKVLEYKDQVVNMGNNGIEYAGESKGEAKFIKKMVSTVSKSDVPEVGISRILALQPKVAPRWEPKHKIFLSHSGVQKAFTEHLCEKLEAIQHFPFFDTRSDSLRKGEKFYPPLMRAAQECLIVILVLSHEFFTSSKWPMMELNKFVKAQESNNKRLKILPLYFKITVEEFKRRKNGHDWITRWEDFKKHDESINLDDWMHAVSKIQGNNGIEYDAESKGEAEFIKKVVSVVCKLDVSPDVKWDMSHVQSMETLCEPIMKKLKEVGPSDVHKVRVVGLHGMGGVGKTTISREVCNQMVGGFAGKVCHVELGGMNLKEQMKIVLRELTMAGPEILDVNHDKLVYLLKERMRRQKVFLILDNILDIEIEEVERYLGVGYHDGSMVLVVSRSLDVLENGLRIPFHHCMEMPNLDKKGAIDVLLHYTGLSWESIKSSDEWEIVERCVKECYFLKKENKVYDYHPLALKALGRHLGRMPIAAWDESLKAHEFNMLKHKIHPVFSILRTGYDVLGTEEQYIFLDLALIWVSKWRSKNLKLCFEWEWLCTIHRKSEVDMKESVKALQRKGLLESVHDIEELDFSIHDLYVEFAAKEAQAGPFVGRRFLLKKYKTEVPHELMKQPPSQCWLSLERLVIHNSEARTLKRANLHHCKNVEVLDLDCCEELEEVDVTGMVNLRCIVVTYCTKLSKWVGFNKLSNLVILRCIGCPNLKELKELAHDFCELNQLQCLDVSECKSLTSLVGIACAPTLQKLNASRCSNLRELPDDFSGLKQLQFLDVRGCTSLTGLIGNPHAPTLEELKANGCQVLV